MGARVLIVDDSVFTRVSLIRLLKENGFEVAGEASNGVDAVRRYQEVTPDVVTMDLNLPGLDGIAASREILKLDPHAKIVIVTSVGDEGRVAAAAGLGIRAYLRKPFTPEKLVEALRGQFFVTTPGANRGSRFRRVRGPVRLGGPRACSGDQPGAHRTPVAVRDHRALE